MCRIAIIVLGVREGDISLFHTQKSHDHNSTLLYFPDYLFSLSLSLSLSITYVVYCYPLTRSPIERFGDNILGITNSL